MSDIYHKIIFLLGKYYGDKVEVNRDPGLRQMHSETVIFMHFSEKFAKE